MALFIRTPSITKSTRLASKPRNTGLLPPCWLFCTKILPVLINRSPVFWALVCAMVVALITSIFCAIFFFFSAKLLADITTSSRLISFTVVSFIMFFCCANPLYVMNNKIAAINFFFIKFDLIK